MENYPANSRKSREEQKQLPQKKNRVEKVVTGQARTKKKSEVRKLADNFLAEDMSSIKNYAITDVLIPSVKKAIKDIVSNGIDMLLYGGSGDRRDSRADRVSYRKYSDKGDDYRRYSENRNRSFYFDSDVIVDTRGEAEEILRRMDDLIATYGMASVADLFDLAGLSCEYTDNKYGWTSIRTAEVIRARDGGYAIKMPRAMPID